ncbi:MAG: hypothetical protein ABIJ42_11560 [Acidobacteriota bacterium]
MAKPKMIKGPSNRNIDTLGKVVIHTREHKTHRGFSKRKFIGDGVRILDENGNESTFPLKDLKAVFFVKAFSGDPAYDEVLFLRKETPRPWLWVHIEFEDGEKIEGKIKNNEEIINGSDGFFIWFSDEFSNSESVYVVKDFIRKFRIMGIGDRD